MSIVKFHQWRYNLLKDFQILLYKESLSPHDKFISMKRIPHYEQLYQLYTHHLHIYNTSNFNTKDEEIQKEFARTKNILDLVLLNHTISNEDSEPRSNQGMNIKNTRKEHHTHEAIDFSNIPLRVHSQVNSIYSPYESLSYGSKLIKMLFDPQRLFAEKINSWRNLFDKSINVNDVIVDGLYLEETELLEYLYKITRLSISYAHSSMHSYVYSYVTDPYYNEDVRDCLTCKPYTLVLPYTSIHHLNRTITYFTKQNADAMTEKDYQRCLRCTHNMNMLRRYSKWVDMSVRNDKNLNSVNESDSFSIQKNFLLPHAILTPLAFITFTQEYDIINELQHHPVIRNIKQQAILSKQYQHIEEEPVSIDWILYHRPIRMLCISYYIHKRNSLLLNIFSSELINAMNRMKSSNINSPNRIMST